MLKVTKNQQTSTPTNKNLPFESPVDQSLGWHVYQSYNGMLRHSLGGEVIFFPAYYGSLFLIGKYSVFGTYTLGGPPFHGPPSCKAPRQPTMYVLRSLK